MDKNLKYFNKINANLGYIVDDLRNQQEHMQTLISMHKHQIRYNDNTIKGFKNAVYKTVQKIDDFEALQAEVRNNLYPLVKT